MGKIPCWFNIEYARRPADEFPSFSCVYRDEKTQVQWFKTKLLTRRVVDGAWVFVDLSILSCPSTLYGCCLQAVNNTVHSSRGFV